MLQVIRSIIINVLTALYQPFWFSIILSILFMFVWKNYSGIKAASKQWIKWFKEEIEFRKMFLLVFYIVMILFRTLLNRNIWQHTLQNVLGYWWIYKEDGTLTTQCFENLALFIPFIFLLLWTCKDRILCDKVRFVYAMWQYLKIAFLFSATIEFLQLFIRLGTWQHSDIFYNTLGGVIGGFMYCLFYKIRNRNYNCSA